MHATALHLLGLDHEQLTYFFEGRWHPNPFAFALDAVELPDKLGLRAIVGNTHGDLHGYNVLVGRENGSVKYYMIDMAFYDPEAYLLYDHAYFEISHLLNRRGALALADWVQMVAVLEVGGTPQADEVGIIQMLREIRQQVRVWVDHHEPNRLSYLDGQFMLARVAAGLNFASKGMPDTDRVRAFLYAALCLKTYLKFHNVDWVKQGSPLEFSPAS